MRFIRMGDPNHPGVDENGRPMSEADIEAEAMAKAFGIDKADPVTAIDAMPASFRALIEELRNVEITIDPERHPRRCDEEDNGD